MHFQRLTALLLLFILLPLAADDRSSLEYLATRADYLSDSPLQIDAQNGRVYLIYPRGYLDLNDQLRLDGRSLLSLWNSQRQDLPVYHRAWLLESQLILIDDRNELYQLSLPLGNTHFHSTLPRSFQRILLLSSTQMLGLEPSGWTYWRFDDYWEEQRSYPMSPMTLLIRPMNQLWFYDPLSRILADSRASALQLDPVPQNLIIQAEADGNYLYLWDHRQCLIYSMDQGELIETLAADHASYSYFSVDNGNIYRLHLPTGKVTLQKGEEGSLELQVNDSIWRDWLLSLYQQYADELPVELSDNKEFHAWLLQLVQEYYLRNPLDREIRELKTFLESQLDEGKTTLY